MIKNKLFNRIIMTLSFLMLMLNVQSQNIIFDEHFESCETPELWETEVFQGDANWSVININRADPDFGDPCVWAFVDLPAAGKGDTSHIEFSTPWVQPLVNADSLFFSFDLTFIKQDADPSEARVYFERGNGRELFMTYKTHVWGVDFNDPQHVVIPISNSMHMPIRLVVEYHNHGVQNAAISFDRFQLKGVQNKICDEAIEIFADQAQCTEGNNLGTESNPVMDACGGVQTDKELWYSYLSDQRALVKLTTSAQFNDVVDVYFGRCTDLVPFACSSRDAHGFEGEEVYFTVTPGIRYYFRVSALNEAFSFYSGDLCIALNTVQQIPDKPINEICSSATELTLNSACTPGENYYADMDGPTPLLNGRAKADVWYKFNNTSSSLLSFKTNADFADCISVYSGDCDNLEWVLGSERGQDVGQFELKPNQDYYFQVSGYFSSLEGLLCAEIFEINVPELPNNLCVDALALPLNINNCTEVSLISATKSGIKSSCQIYANDDVWYSFIAPDDGNIYFQFESEFVFDYAIYHGECDSLIELTCGVNPHSCEGFEKVINLNVGEEYFLQVSDHKNEFGVLKGDICISAYDKENLPVYEPLSLSVEVVCVSPGLARLEVQGSGGTGNISFVGNQNGDYLLTGEKIHIIIQDEKGCRQIYNSEVSCQTPECEDSDLEINLDIDCETDALGLQTGRTIINYSISGGAPNYQVLGNANGDIIENGDEYRIIVLDSNNCLRSVLGTADCEPFTCEQSDLSLTVDYECIDSLLRAKLTINAVDGNGNYMFSGDLDGALLETGQSFTSIVTDEAGCSIEVSGTIMCDFDSCAFSNLSAIVDYTCLTDDQGGQTGEAVLNVTTSGGQGMIDLSGNQHGDTLFNGDPYSLILTDSWGCSIEVKGVVECWPVSTKNINNGLIDRLYPVPTSGWTTLSYRSLQNGIVTLQIYSIDGKVVWQEDRNLKVGTNEILFNVQNLTNGVYHLRAQQGDILSIGKLIIQK